MAYAEKRGRGAKPWRVKYKLPSGIETSESGFETKDAALTWGRDQEARIREGRWTDSNAGKITVSAWIDRWMPLQDVGISTVETREYLIRRFIRPSFGTCELGSLTTEDITRWENSIPARLGVSRRVARDVGAVLCTILGDAAAAKPPLIPYNPAIRPRNRGRRTGRKLDRGPQRVWATPLQALLVAERAAPGCRPDGTRASGLARRPDATAPPGHRQLERSDTFRPLTVTLSGQSEGTIEGAHLSGIITTRGRRQRLSGARRRARVAALSAAVIACAATTLAAGPAWASDGGYSITAAAYVGDNPSAVAVSPDGTLVYVPDSAWYSRTVTVFNTATNQVTGTIRVRGAADVAFSPSGAYAYVTSYSENSMSVVRTATGRVTGTIPIGRGQFRVVFSPSGRYAYVSDNNPDHGFVSVISTATRRVIATIGVGSIAGALAVSPNGRYLYVTNEYSPNSVSVISTATRRIIATIGVRLGARELAVSPSGRDLYATGDIGRPHSLSVISTATRRVIATIRVGLYPAAVAFSPDGSRAFVTNDLSGTVSVIRTATNHVIGTVIAPCHPASVAVSPDGTHIYVAHDNRRDGNLSVITHS